VKKLNSHAYVVCLFCSTSPSAGELWGSPDLRGYDPQQCDKTYH